MSKRPMTATWPLAIVVNAQPDFTKRYVTDAESGDHLDNVSDVVIHVGAENPIRADVTAYDRGEDGRIVFDLDGAKTFTRSFEVDLLPERAFEVRCDYATVRE